MIDKKNFPRRGIGKSKSVTQWAAKKKKKKCMRRRIGGDEIPRRRIEGRRLMTVARRPRRIRKVMRPLLQWYYNLNLLLLLLLLPLLLLPVPPETRSPSPFRAPPLLSLRSASPLPPLPVLRSRSSRWFACANAP